ncbi:hypothetical protein P170DRAFT_430162 [Aspergillus steynii IBT 23096]|uniref:FHA domain protein n=1 Tax=Aspergillus steynii IBT 23096 TaxID=1392250 RepID=A0A2I2FUC9_9EURO|nr:uncharacterized protein P170DRAFT_430162 [Aspergillus steynii IBT 23096]PLB44258.1 hypothetical protein P170DRAFT_430162 [Aspergillus steynii IBT 23096]
MSTSVAAASNDDSRAGPLRRLSQLRAYTHGHLSPQLSSASQRLTRQNTLGSRVNRLCPAPFLTVIEDDSSDSDDASIVETTSNNPAPCPEPEQSARNNSSTSLSSFRGLQIEWPFETRHSESSSSTPSTDLAESFSQESMARLRGSSQPSESRADEAAPTSAPAELQSALFDSPDPVATENFPSSPRPRQKATIRFFPHQESQSSARPSLPFIPVSRTLPSESCIIKVGRYSERDGLPQPNPTEPSDAPVGFKSKVVSRRHCEFMYVNGQWHIKDVGSSSGTFLNHMRLSQPNMASRLYTVKDGDIVQLGIDFRGGEEMIFRCVRIRIECNRSWQQQPNEFKYADSPTVDLLSNDGANKTPSKNTESLIKNLGKGETADYAGCRECSICLGSVLRPYQCLFMAACAHVWHYKCIMRLIHTPDYPMFQCPNCRAYTDLSAEVDDSNDFEAEDTEQKSSAAEEKPSSSSEEIRTETHSTPSGGNHVTNTSLSSVDEALDGLPSEAGLAANIESMRLQDSEAARETARESDHPTSSNLETVPTHTSSDIPGWQAVGQTSAPIQCRQAQLRSDTPVRSESSEDNPLTPQNDSGPLAFDGRASMSET